MQLNKKRQYDKSRAVVKVATRLIRNGIQWGLESETLIELEGIEINLVVCELKVKATKTRVMTYLHDDENQTPVLLFYFEGHEINAHGGIPPEQLRKGERLAQIARSFLLEEEKAREKEKELEK